MADRKTRTDPYIIPALRGKDYVEPPPLTPMPQGQTTEPDIVLPAAKALGKKLAGGLVSGAGGQIMDMAQMAMLAQPGAMISPTVKKAAENVPLTSTDLATKLGLDPNDPAVIAAQAMAPGVPAAKAKMLGLALAGSLKNVAKPVQKIGDLKIVSTRFPTAVKATEDPVQDLLIVDLETMQKDPVQYKHNVKVVEAYPNLKLKGTPAQKGEQFIEHVKDNLLHLHDQVPDATRQRSKLWYDGANKIAEDFGKKYEIPKESVAGVFAVLSPQMDWFKNVSLGERVLDVMTKKQNDPWTPEMQATAERIYGKPQYKPIIDEVSGKTLSQLEDAEQKAIWLRVYDETYMPRSHRVVTPEGEFANARMKQDGKTEAGTGWGSNNEIKKAINIIEDGSMANISRQLGGQHKVRNFYNNIIDPNGTHESVTIDTHAVAAGLMRPLAGADIEVAHNFGSNVKGTVGPKNSAFTGMKGTYGIYAEAYRRAAKERGILPREMQSITWEAVRGLYNPQYKGNKANVKVIDDIWTQHKKGKITLDEARQQALDHAGGIDAPEWEATVNIPEVKTAKTNKAVKMILDKDIPNWATKKRKQKYSLRFGMKDGSSGPLADASQDEINEVAKRLDDDFNTKSRTVKEGHIFKLLKDVRYEKLEPIQKIPKLFKILDKKGVKQIGTGDSIDSSSYYYEMPDGKIIRIADHLPTRPRSTFADVFITYGQDPYPYIHQKPGLYNDDGVVAKDAIYTENMSIEEVLGKINSEFKKKPNTKQLRENANNKELPEEIRKKRKSFEEKMTIKM
jgi:hypothetical protein